MLSLARLRRGNWCVVVFLQVIIDHAAHLSFNGNCDGYGGGGERARTGSFDYRHDGLAGRRIAAPICRFPETTCPLLHIDTIHVHPTQTTTMNPSTFKNPFSSGLGRVRRKFCL
jgi:hypothetical protein